MNRSGRSINPVLSQHRRGHSLNLAGGNKDAVTDENNLDLFSKNRRSLSVTSSDESSDGTFPLFFPPNCPSWIVSFRFVLYSIVRYWVCFTPRTNTAIGDWFISRILSAYSFCFPWLDRDTKTASLQSVFVWFQWWFSFIDLIFDYLKDLIYFNLFLF